MHVSAECTAIMTCMSITIIALVVHTRTHTHTTRTYRSDMHARITHKVFLINSRSGRFRTHKLRNDDAAQQGLTDSADVVESAFWLNVVIAVAIVEVVVVAMAADTVAASEFIIFAEHQYLFAVHLVINTTIRCETQSQLQCSFLVYSYG